MLPMRNSVLLITRMRDEKLIFIRAASEGYAYETKLDGMPNLENGCGVSMFLRQLHD